MNSHFFSVKDIELINKLSGENVNVCMQCGTCSSACPMTDEMDFFPRKVMHFSQLGSLDRLQRINTHWKCASCHSCSVRCPRGIDIAKIMEALRLVTLRKNKNFIEPSEIPREKLGEYPAIAMVAGLRKLTS